MVHIWKYALVLALALGAVYVDAGLSLGGFAKLPWLDDINVIVNKSLALAKPEAAVSPVDPIAAANVDEDLDYRIAQRMNSAEGWRSFLTAHPDGPHAQAARAGLDQLVAAETLPPPMAAQVSDTQVSDTQVSDTQVSDTQVSDGGPPETKTPSEAASPAEPSPESEVATLAPDDLCRRDEDRLEQFLKSPTSGEAARFLAELRCETLRPELLRLTETLDGQAPTAPAVAARDPASGDATEGPASSAPSPAVSTVFPLPPPRLRATEPQKRRRSTVSSRSLQPKRHASRRAAPSLPPILLALFGERPRNSTPFRRTRAGGGRIRATSPGASH